MKQTVIPVKPDGKLNIKASADLRIEGTPQQFLTAIGEHGDALKLTDVNGVVEVRATDDCRLLIPEQMNVTVERCGGDASISNLKTHLIIGKVGGDLTLKSIAGISVESVGGDFTFRTEEGGVEVARTGGDLMGDGVPSLTSKGIGGDVILRNILGTVDLAAGADVTLSSMLSELPQMNIKAAGDIKLVVDKSAKAQLELVCGDEIRVSACGQEFDVEEDSLSLPLGEGGNVVKLTAGGDIIVTETREDYDFDDIFSRWDNDWKDFGVNLEKTIRESLNLASEKLSQASEQASQAGSLAQEKLDRAMRKLEKHGIDGNKKWVGVAFDTPAPLKEKPKSGMSEEERLMVLRMLQEKKITVEEAEKLLSALDK
jgi:hypothetical protein